MKKAFWVSATLVFVAGSLWLQPRTNQASAATPKEKEEAAKLPTSITPLPQATSKPTNQPICMTQDASLVQPKEKESAAPKIELGRSFVIPKALVGELSHLPAVTYRADGEKLFTVTNKGDLLVWDSSSQEIEKRLTLSSEAITSVVIDPRGCFVAWSTKSDFYSMALDGGTPQKIKGMSPTSIAISPKGGTVAVSTKDKIELHLLQDSSLLSTISGASGEVDNLAFSPDGESLAAVTKKGSFLLFETKTGKKQKEIQKQGALYAVAYSPDGKKIAFGGDERIVYQLDQASGAVEQVSQNQPYYITTLSYSPDGRYLALGDESCDVWLYRLRDNANIFHGKHHVECWLNGVTWTPDGHSFIFACRPNTLAGRPALYLENNINEASQHEEVVNLDNEIKKNEESLAVLLTGEANATQRKRLEEIQKQRNNQAVASVYLNNNLNGVNLNFVNDNVAPNGVNLGGLNIENNVVLNNVTPNGGIPIQNNIAFNNVEIQTSRATNNLQEANSFYDELAKDPKLSANATALRSLNEQRQKSFDAQLKYLNDNFCINQWVIQN